MMLVLIDRSVIGPHEERSADLAPMILAALKEETPLVTDGKGNVSQIFFKI